MRKIGQAEALLHALAREFDGDQAATDAARALRIPGFLNKKYDQYFHVSARFQTDHIYRSRDFKLRTESVESDHRNIHSAPRRTTPSEPRRITQSERDWAYVKGALASGVDPEELISQLAHSRVADKSDPLYYARLTVTKAVEDLRMRAAHTPHTPVDENHRETEH